MSRGFSTTHSFHKRSAYSAGGLDGDRKGHINGVRDLFQFQDHDEGSVQSTSSFTGPRRTTLISKPARPAAPCTTDSYFAPDQTPVFL